MKPLYIAVIISFSALSSAASSAVDMIVHNAAIKTFDGETYSGFTVDDGYFVYLTPSYLNKKHQRPY